MNETNFSFSEEAQRILQEGKDPWTGEKLLGRLCEFTKRRLKISPSNDPNIDITEEITSEMNDFLSCLTDVQRARFFVASTFHDFRSHEKEKGRPRSSKKTTPEDDRLDFHLIMPAVIQKLSELEKSREDSTPMSLWACKYATDVFQGIAYPKEASSLTPDGACQQCEDLSRGNEDSHSKHLDTTMYLDSEGFFDIKSGRNDPKDIEASAMDLSLIEDESFRQFMGHIFQIPQPKG